MNHSFRRPLAGLLMFATVSLTAGAHAWDGTDRDTGSSIEIEKGNLVRRGMEIEYYDSSAGEYRTGEVESISRFGTSVEVEISDSETGETRTFDMDD